MRSRLAKWKDKIAEKVGADKISIEISEPSKELANKSVEKIKDKEFSVYFNKTSR